MNWKAIFAGVITGVLAIVVYEMFVKNLIGNQLESYFDFDEQNYLDGYAEKHAA